MVLAIENPPKCQKFQIFENFASFTKNTDISHLKWHFEDFFAILYV